MGQGIRSRNHFPCPDPRKKIYSKRMEVPSISFKASLRHFILVHCIAVPWLVYAAQVAPNTKVPSRVIQRRTPRPARYMYTCLQAICFCLFQTLVFLWKNRRGELISGHLELFWSLKIVKDDDTLEKLLVPMLLAWECKGRCLRYRRLHYNNVYLYHYIHRLPFGWRWHIYAMVAIFWDR